MCKLCNGTHVVHEVESYSYRFKCCPDCGPEPIEIRNVRLDRIIAWADEKIKEATTIDHH
jgi:hypothetical protein